MPAGDVFGLDGFFLNVSNPVTVSTIGINSTGSSAGITVVSGILGSAGIATLTLSTAAGLSTTPFYVGAKIAVSGLGPGNAYPGYNGTFVVTGFAGTTTVSYATTGYVGSAPASITGQTGRVVLVTDTQVTNTTWSSAQTHGWFGGGVVSGPSFISTVERIDFSNDTGSANIRGSLSVAKGDSRATGNSNYGWFGGGTNAPSTYFSTVERIDFSNDSASLSLRGGLSRGTSGLVATGNSNYGWFAAGRQTATNVTIIDRIDFSNDSSTASQRGALNAVTYRAATGNSNYGWFAGGVGAAVIDRIDFSNDSVLSPRGRLGQVRRRLAATGNSNYGWFGGGVVIPGNTYVSTVDRIDFSNDLSYAPIRGPLTAARGYDPGATGNSNYGWFGGGNNPSAPSSPSSSRVDRIDFSNDSVTASIRNPLSLRKYQLAATSGQARSSSIRPQKGGNFGWFGGGYSGAPPASSRVDRIDFSNDTSTPLVRGILSLVRQTAAATGNSNYGWFGGSNNSASVDRIDFSNDLATASRRGGLTSTRYYLAATGNSNYGWFGGGYNPSFAPKSLTRVDRINFSNDSTTALVRGSLSVPGGRSNVGATGNSNYGWFAGGANPTSSPNGSISTVDRIDFSNDSVGASPRTILSYVRSNSAATSNSNYGWFGGGAINGSTKSSTTIVERINFSNDSTPVLVRGPLTISRNLGAATGNSNYGWWTGTVVNPDVARVERINFTNDTVSTLPRGSLGVGRYGLGATSNTPVG